MLFTKTFEVTISSCSGAWTSAAEISPTEHPLSQWISLGILIDWLNLLYWSFEYLGIRDKPSWLQRHAVLSLESWSLMLFFSLFFCSWARRYWILLFNRVCMYLESCEDNSISVLEKPFYFCNYKTIGCRFIIPFKHDSYVGKVERKCGKFCWFRRILKHNSDSHQKNDLFRA